MINVKSDTLSSVGEHAEVFIFASNLINITLKYVLTKNVVATQMDQMVLHATIPYHTATATAKETSKD